MSTDLYGLRVFVYRNLHKKCWSVRALEGPRKGRVVAHVQEIHLRDCEFKVSEAGRQRVLREKRKNVHAGIAGTVETGPTTTQQYQGFTYNPYRDSSFIHVGRFPSRPLKTAEHVWLDHSSSWYYPEQPYELKLPSIFYRSNE